MTGFRKNAITAPKRWIQVGKYNCSTCGTEVDWEKEASTECSGCDKHFCSALHGNCFSEHVKEHKCKGTALTILDPQWSINLRQPEEAERG